MEVLGMTDKQYDGVLIDMLEDLRHIRRKAEQENATETLKLIDEVDTKLKRKLRGNQ